MSPRTATKTCSKCGETKRLTEFRSAKRSKDGLSSWCSACHVEATTASFSVASPLITQCGALGHQLELLSGVGIVPQLNLDLSPSRLARLIAVSPAGFPQFPLFL